MKNKFILLATLAIGFAGCEPEFEKEVTADYTSGEANFSSYVAVGNSLTAGYMDGTVSRIGQTYSYPNLLAQQFALVGGGAFTQPSFAEDVDNFGGISGIPGFNNRLVIDASQGRPEPIVGTSKITLTSQAKAFNNMGVPGAKSFHLLAPGYGNLAGVNLGLSNPYFVRHATTPMATVFGDALTKAPTFFTNWIGNNDVLAYATSGGAGLDRNDNNTLTNPDAANNGNPAAYGSNDITNTSVFAAVYSFLINGGTNPLTGQTGQLGLTSNGAKGVVCTIPSVTSIPYFTTVPFKPAPLDNTKATQLDAGYAGYNGGLDVAFNNGLISSEERLQRKIDFIAGLNSVVIVDTDLTNLSSLGIPSYRMTTADDLIVLPASSFIGTLVGGDPTLVNGLSVPLANKWVLTAKEKAKVAAATTAFNASIIAIANAKNTAAGKTVIAVADMNAIMNKLVTGLKIETGSIYTANYFSGSATEGQVLFSLDGVHPNARGYAVIANEIIKVINVKFKANLPLHNPTYFPGINIVPSN